MSAAAVELRALKPLTYNRQAVDAGETFTAGPTHARLLVLGKRAVLVTSGASTPEAPATPPVDPTPAPELEPPPPALEPEPVEDDPEPTTPDPTTLEEEGRRVILPTRAAAAASGRRPSSRRPGR